MKSFPWRGAKQGGPTALVPTHINVMRIFLEMCYLHTKPKSVWAYLCWGAFVFVLKTIGFSEVFPGNFG